MMTSYYSDLVAGRIYEKAKDKLKSLQGKTLTPVELTEIFGPYDTCQPSCYENRDAFDWAVRDKLLISVPPENYLVATH